MPTSIQGVWSSFPPGGGGSRGKRRERPFTQGPGVIPSSVERCRRRKERGTSGCFAAGAAAAAHSKWTTAWWALRTAAADGGANRLWEMWRSLRRWGRRRVRDQKRAAWGREKGSGGAPIWIWTGLGPGKGLCGCVGVR